MHAGGCDHGAPLLEFKPGITDLATIAFRNEEELLRTAEDTEKYYMEYCMPKKIELNLTYARHATLWKDVKIILQTLFPWWRLACAG